MIQLQVLNKILKDKSLKFLNENNLDETYFNKYQDEYNFIIKHYQNYQTIPDLETFVDKFNNFDIIDVKESDDYLLKALNEECLFNKAVPILQKVKTLLETDSIAATNYLISKLPDLTTNIKFNSIDLIKGSDSRYDAYIEKQEGKAKMVTFSGFEEIDKVTGGFNMGEELICILARTNQGKSWLLYKLAVEAWKQGRRVGIYSGEMSANMVGYRVDTLIHNISNTALNRGLIVKDYKEYLEELKKNEFPIQVITPNDIGGNLTATKLEQFIEKYKLDVVAIDQLSLMSDERSGKNEQLRIKYGNITKDLFRISTKYKIPIYLAVQANRLGARGKEDKGTPDLENAAESDAVAQDASRLFAMRQKDGFLEIEIKKDRYSRVGDKFTYEWDIDKGKFLYVPSNESRKDDIKRAEELKNSFTDGTEVF